MALKAFLVVALAVCVDALQLSVLATSPVASSRCAAPTMKHKDYFTRIARADGGRLRLCVSR